VTTRRLFVLIFLLSLFALSVRETLDPDLWWHLRTGELILSDGIPRQDPYSFTVPEHSWLPHEWLSELFMWSVYQQGGLAALMLVFAGLVTLAYGLVYLASDGKPYLAGFVVLLAAISSAPFWGARPQVFNMLFTAAFVYLVEGFRAGTRHRKTLLLLPLLTILWANLHSGYLTGVALLAIYTGGEGLQHLLRIRPNRSLSRSDVTWLGAMTALSFLAAALNPSGFDLWVYPFFTLGSGAMQAYIQEWQSPNFHAPIFWPFAALFFLGIFSWLVSRGRPAWTDVLLFCALAAAGLLSVRHIPLFAIVAAPIVARYLTLAAKPTRLRSLTVDPPPGPLGPGKLALNAALLLLALLAAGLWSAQRVANNAAAIQGNYPVAAADYLLETGLGDSGGYNTYHWGGYLIWRGLPVFVDGRADVYGDAFLHEYRQTMDLTSRWQEPLDKYGAAYVLVEERSPLVTLLATSAQWREAYRDEIAVVFVRADNASGAGAGG
jgi:hypothetical protein